MSLDSFCPNDFDIKESRWHARRIAQVSLSRAYSVGCVKADARFLDRAMRPGSGVPHLRICKVVRRIAEFSGMLLPLPQLPEPDVAGESDGLPPPDVEVVSPPAAAAGPLPRATASRRRHRPP